MAEKWLQGACLILILALAAEARGDKVKDKVIDKVKDKDMMRKSIVFDKKTPDVFYCPQHKPTSMNKLFVNSRPLHKLCEFEGRLPLPPDYKSDCYNDVDESDYACKEKYRIMKRMKGALDLQQAGVPTAAEDLVADY